jgi:hypothetical protein
MKTVTLELTESEAWVVSTALFQYYQDPISELHGDVSLGLYNRIKNMILKSYIEPVTGTCYIGDEER